MNFWYWLYLFFGLIVSWYFGLLRGKGPTTSLFLILQRFYFFTLLWIPFQNIYIISAILLIYLPYYIDLSEFNGRAHEGLRHSTIAKYLKSYFGCELIKSVDIKDDKAIIAMHPHGVMPFGSVINISTHVSNFSELFPTLKDRVIIAASGCFILPFFRDLILAAGVVDCTKFSVMQWLDLGYTICVYPGGTREALYSNPDIEWLDLKRKTGFIKLALQYDIPVIPCYNFNEVNHFQQYAYDKISTENALLHTVRANFQLVFGVMLPFLYNIIPQPNNKVITVMGKPVYLNKLVRYKATVHEIPPDDIVEKAMNIYIEELKDLYTQNSCKYNNVVRKLVIT